MGIITMKQSLIDDYLKALKTLVNDSRVSFAITSNFADKCHIVAIFNSQVVHNFTLFNDSSIVNYDNLINDYLAVMVKHPAKQGDKQLFSLRYDSRGYCSLAVTDSGNYELFGVSHKRISKSLAKYLLNNIAFDDKYYMCDYCSRYIATYDFNITVLFSV